MKINNNGGHLIFNAKNIVLLFYCFSLAAGMFASSTFPHTGFFDLLTILFTIIAFFVSLIFIKFDYYEFGLLIIGLLICLKGLVQYPAVEKNYACLVLIIFCMSNISPKRILKYSTITMTTCLFIIYISMKLGLISNNIVYRAGVARQSLGTNYPLTFGSYVFFICAALVVLINNKKIKIIQSIIFIIVAWILNKITGARNFGFAIVLLAIVNLFSNNILFFCKKWVFKLIIWITIIVSIFSVFITEVIPYYSTFYQELDKLLNGRLAMQYILLKFYQPKLFGQYIYQSANPYGYYFYIDSSYAKLIFIAGILFTVYYFTVLIKQLHNFLEINLYNFILVFIVILITGLVQGSAIGVSSNIFLPLLCVKMDLFKKDFKDEKL